MTPDVAGPSVPVPGPWRLSHALVVWIGGNFAAVVAALFWAGSGFDVESVAALFVIGAVQVFAYVLFIVLLSRRVATGSPARDLGFRFEAGDAAGLLWGIGLLFLWLVVAAAVLSVLGIADPPTQEVIDTASEAVTLGDILLVIGVAAIAVPVAEELLFRGVLLAALRDRMSDRAAVWLSGVVFGVAHLVDPNAAPFVPALILIGVVLGFQAVRTGRLGRSIFTHMGFNGASVILTLLFSTS